MNTELLYSKALTPTDIEDIVALYQQLSPNKPAATQENVRKAIEENCVFVVRDTGKRVVGMATLVTIHKLEGAYGYVHDVVVLDRERGKKLGRVLMEDLLAEARLQGLLYLELTSGNQREVAIVLYTSLGFSPHDTNIFRLPLSQK